MIEVALHSLLSPVTPRVYPTQVPENADLPHVVYTVTASEPQRTLKGAGSLVRHTVQIESRAETLAEALSLQTAVRSILDGHTGGVIHRSFWDTQDTQLDEDSFHATSSYTVWRSVASA